MILEKDSSVLGYPGEISKPLNADHHGVCKFENNRDPNYITVRNILKSLMGKILPANPAKLSKGPVVSNLRESFDLKAMLAISELPDVDYIFFRDQWTRGTNEWILKEPAYVEWLRAHKSTPNLLWVNGGAAAGKSVLSSFIINSLVEQDLRCQYFFIRFNDRKKRSLGLLIRSLAYQIAQQVPSFLEKLTELADEAVDFETVDPKIIWQRMFKSLLFNMKDEQPLYWVIDGLDEADDIRTSIKLLSDIAISTLPIRILLISRETCEIAAGLSKITKEVSQGAITFRGHVEDLRCHISQELRMRGSPEVRESITQRIIEGSQSNFLVSAPRIQNLIDTNLLVGAACCREDKLMSYPCRRGEIFTRITAWHGSNIRSYGLVDYGKFISIRSDFSIDYPPTRHLFVPRVDSC